MEVPIIFGEWFNADTEAIISQDLQTGGGPNVSDAYTINGLPGPLYNCSAKDTFKLKVKAEILIAPGQTTNVLLKTKLNSPNATF